MPAWPRPVLMTGSISDHLADAGIILRIAAISVATPLLASLSLASLERVLEPGIVPRPTNASDGVKALGYVEGILPRLRGLARTDCLGRSIVRYYALRRIGFAVTLVFGVGMLNDHPEGHCWLEKDGQPYLEERDPRSRFVPTYTIPRVARPGRLADSG